MSPAQLDQIIQECPADVRERLGDLRPHILEAATAALEQAQESEDGGTPKVKVSLSLTIDLTKSPVAWVVDGAIGIRRTVKGDAHEADETPELMEGMGRGRKPRTGAES